MAFKKIFKAGAYLTAVPVITATGFTFYNYESTRNDPK